MDLLIDNLLRVLFNVMLSMMAVFVLLVGGDMLFRKRQQNGEREEDDRDYWDWD